MFSCCIRGSRGISVPPSSVTALSLEILFIHVHPSYHINWSCIKKQALRFLFGVFVLTLFEHAGPAFDDLIWNWQSSAFRFWFNVRNVTRRWLYSAFLNLRNSEASSPNFPLSWDVINVFEDCSPGLCFRVVNRCSSLFVFWVDELLVPPVPCQKSSVALISWVVVVSSWYFKGIWENTSPSRYPPEIWVC